MQSPRLRTTGLALIIIVVVAFAYYPSWNGEFLWDDDKLVTNNVLLKDTAGLGDIWLSTKPDDYLPLTLTSFWIERRIWDFDPFGYRLVNILLHSLGASLLWLVLRELRVPGAWLGALFFALHPVCVGSVAWIAERKNTLSLPLYLLTAFCYFRSEDSALDETSKRLMYGFAIASFILTLLAKTSTVMLPILLLICAWWQRNRIRKTDLCKIAPFLFLSFVFGLITIWFQHNRAITGDTGDAWARVANGGWAAWFYLSKAVLPTNLCMVYGNGHVANPPHPVLGWVPWLAFAMAAYGIWKTRVHPWGRSLLFALACYYITLLPVLGFIDMSYLVYSAAGDHLQYLAIISIAALAGATLVQVFSRLSLVAFSKLPHLAGAIVAVLLGVLTYQRAATFADAETLWRVNVKKCPSAWVAYTNLGFELIKQKRFEEAKTFLESGIRIYPGYPLAYSNLGAIFAREGKIPEAITLYYKALALSRDLPATRGLLAEALLSLGKREEAIAELDRILANDPGYALALLTKARVLTETGLTAEARVHYERVLSSEPDNVRALSGLADCYLKEGRAAQAVSHLQHAIVQNPTEASLHYLLAQAHLAERRAADATKHFREALRIRPDWAEVCNNLAWLLAVDPNLSRRNGDEAVALAERAIRSEQKPEYLDTLAAAYAEAGRFHDAVIAAEQATEMFITLGQTNMAKATSERLTLYKTGTPFREIY